MQSSSSLDTISTFLIRFALLVQLQVALPINKANEITIRCLDIIQVVDLVLMFYSLCQYEEKGKQFQLSFFEKSS
jgi:hypothetical protein